MWIWTEILASSGDPETGEIIELFCVWEEQATLRQEVYTFQPRKRLRPHWFPLNGVSPSALAASPYFEELAPWLLERFESRAIVHPKHRLISSFLSQAFQKAGLDPKLPKPNDQATRLCHQKLRCVSEFRWPRSRLLDPSRGLVGGADPNAKKLRRDPGVYLLYNDNNELVYVGKATRLADRIQSHFYADRRNAKEAKLKELSFYARLIPCGHPLFAEMLETRLIQNFLPLLNRKSRKAQPSSGLGLLLAPSGIPFVRIQKEADDRCLCFVPTDTASSAFRIKRFLLAQNGVCGFAESGSSAPDRPCFKYQLDRCSGACADPSQIAFATEQLRTLMTRFQKPCALNNQTLFTEHSTDYLLMVASNRRAWLKIKSFKDLIPLCLSHKEEFQLTAAIERKEIQSTSPAPHGLPPEADSVLGDWARLVNAHSKISLRHLPDRDHDTTSIHQWK